MSEAPPNPQAKKEFFIKNYEKVMALYDQIIAELKRICQKSGQAYFVPLKQIRHECCDMFIKANIPDENEWRNYIVYHVLIGGTMIFDGSTKVDLPGEYSIQKYLETKLAELKLQ